MPSEKHNSLEFKQYMKSHKMSYNIYADIKSLVKKRCANNPKKYSATKIGDNIPYGYLMSPVWGFDHIENKQYTLYRGKDCMKKF